MSASHPRSRRSRLRLTVPAAAVAALALTLAACSSGAPSAAGTGSAGGADSLNVLMISSHQGAADYLAKRYKEETGITINPTIVPYDQIGNTLDLDQQSGANQYDAAAVWYVSIGDLAADGSIQDLTDWIDSTPAIEKDDFIQSIYDPYSLVDGKRYGLPFDGDSHVLFYNKTILERNGITSPPKTWDEYVQDSKIVTQNEGANGVYGNVIFGQKSPLILGASFANRLAGFGGTFVDAQGKPTINSPQAVQAAQSLVDALGSAYPTPAETDFGAGNTAWYAGKAAFIENWTDLGVGSQINPASTVKDQWGVVPLPVGGSNTTPRASLVAGFTWVVSANTKKTQEAKDFIQWATSSKINEELLTADPQTGIDPNRSSTLNSTSYAQKYPELAEVNHTSLNGTLPWPTGKNATKAAEVLTDELANLIAGQENAQQALDKVQAQWEQLLG